MLPWLMTLPKKVISVTASSDLRYDAVVLRCSSRVMSCVAMLSCVFSVGVARMMSSKYTLARPLVMKSCSRSSMKR